MCVCVCVCSSVTSFSTIFSSYHDVDVIYVVSEIPYLTFLPHRAVYCNYIAIKLAILDENQ